MDPTNKAMADFAKRTVKIGDIEICYPAFVTLICGFIVFVVLALNEQIILSIFTLALFMLTTYNVNCVVVGNCTTWAWILMFIYVINVLTVVGAASAYNKMKYSMAALNNSSRYSKK